MHLVLDTRWIFDAISGIGVHTRELVRHLPAHLDALDRVTLLFETEALRDRLAAETGHAFESAIIGYGPNSLANQRQLPRDLAGFGEQAKAAESDTIYHGTNYMLPLLGRLPRTVLTVHDLIPLMVPNYAPRSRKSKIPFLFPAVLKRCIGRAEAVIAVSENTKRDLAAKLGVADEKIHVIYNGFHQVAPADASDADADAKAGAKDLPPFILSVGRRDPYKNLVLLVDAFANLLRNNPDDTVGLQLRVIGPEDPRYPEAPARVHELGLAERVLFLGSVDDATLLDHYRQARLLAFPSSYEGFGLPVLEAMACGTPVVCARSSSLPEVAGEAAVYVPPNDQADLERAMALVLSDEELRKSLISKGLAQTTRFSWDRAAAETAKVYRDLAHR